MIYFAHGSNIDRPQMLVRCPHGRFLSPARLRDYRLCFPRWSKIRDSAIAGIEAARGETVWGVAWEIDEADLARLDLAEGYKAEREPALNQSNRVLVRIDRTDGLSHDAETHIPVPMAEPGRPSPGYLLVFRRAAKALDFPPEFVAQIDAYELGSLAA
jgi:hypothetical protein